MSSRSDATSSSQNFSGRPILYYFLTVCIAVFILDPFQVSGIYSCLSRGWDADCIFPPDGFVQPLTAPEVLTTLTNSARITLFHNFVQVPLVLVVMAPCYFIALYLSRRYHFRRGLNVAIFWVATWLLAATALPVFVAASQLFDPLSRNVWSTLLDGMRLFVPIGFTCGMVYCGLLFLGRRQAPKSD